MGLAGQWSNNYGSVNAVEVLDSNDISYNDEERAYYAFCATSKGMAVFSIYKDDNSLKRQSVRVSMKSFIPIGDCTDIAIGKDKDNNIYAYLTGGDKGLHIIKIEHPESLFYIAKIDTPGSAEGITISKSGDYAFVTDGYRGIQIIDISNPNNPFIAGSCDTPGYSKGIALSEERHYAFVAYRATALCASGLQIIDISNPNNPFIAGSCSTLDSAQGIAIATIRSRDYAFVPDLESGLQVIDISDPTEPFIAGSSPGSAYGVALSKNDQFAFMANGGSGLHIIDISNPNGPFSAGSCNIPGSARVVALSKDGQFAFVACSSGYTDCDGGLQVIDISPSISPFIVGGYGKLDCPGSAQDVTLSQNEQFIYMTDMYKGLQVIDISASISPFIAGTCDTPGHAMSVAISQGGQSAFVADEHYGLQVISINDPINPFIAIGCITPGSAREVALSKDGQFAFVADGDSGLQIIDISDPTSPYIIGSCDTPGFAYGVALSKDGYYVFVADGYSGLQIIDIRKLFWPLWPPFIAGRPFIPGRPFIADSCDTFGSASGVDLSWDGQFAFVADGGNGLLQFKINYHPSPKGNLILVAGCDINYQTPYWHATQALANQVFCSFFNQGYGFYDIYYFNPGFIHDINQDGTYDQLAIDDFDPNVTELKKIIAQFQEDHMTTNTGPLYIYLIGHGAEDRFQLRHNEVISAQELKESISLFLQKNPDRQVVLIIESHRIRKFYR